MEQNNLDYPIGSIEYQAKLADQCLFNGTGYVVHLYLSILKDLHKLLCKIDRDDLAKFADNVYNVFFEHKHRPHIGGDYPIPWILVPDVNYDEFYKKLYPED